MALFSNFVQNVFGSAPKLKPKPNQSTSDTCAYMVKALHKVSNEHRAWLFDSANELQQFMQTHCPTAHLNYLRSEVFEMSDKAPKLIEQHEHLVGNIEWETDRFNEKAARRGLIQPRVETYPNISSACSAVAYFN